MNLAPYMQVDDGPSTLSRCLRECVERTGRPASSHLEHVCVDHRGADVAVTEGFLDGADVCPSLQQMGCERDPVGAPPSRMTSPAGCLPRSPGSAWGY